MNILSPIRYLNRINFGLTLYQEFFEKTINTSSFNNKNEIINHIEKSILKADSNKSKLLFLSGYNILREEGMSSKKGRHLLNNICSIENANHLEVGAWKGSTLIASKFKNKLNSTVIDNWSEFSGPKSYFLKILKKYNFEKSTNFIDQDSFKVDLSNWKNKIQIYYYDGHHSYDSHVKAFTYFNSILDNRFIAIVDDYNNENVKNGTQDAFKTLNYKVIYEKFLPSKYNGDKETWWNGTYIAFIEK